MWVTPSARGKGIGRALVRCIEEWAISRGCGVMVLEVSGDNAGATRLYASLGYAFNGKCVAVSNNTCGGCVQMGKVIE
jgi:GNAT superfamily N-acetyltransferase